MASESNSGQHAKRLGCREAWVLTDRAHRVAMRLYASTGEQAPNEQVMFTFVLDQRASRTPATEEFQSV